MVGDLNPGSYHNFMLQVIKNFTRGEIVDILPRSESV